MTRPLRHSKCLRFAKNVYLNYVIYFRFVPKKRMQEASPNLVPEAKTKGLKSVDDGKVLIGR